MIGWIIAGLLAAAAAIVIVVDGIIDKQKLKEAARNEGVKNAIVERANQCENCVTIKDLDSGQKYDVKGDGISDEIKAGIYI